MILACFPQALSFTCQDGPRLDMLPYTPVVGEQLNLARTYMVLDETYYSILHACEQHRLAKPTQLIPELIDTLPQTPINLKSYWRLPDATARKNLRVCLLNGGGGGLGDGILFAPAVRVLIDMLADHSQANEISVDLFSGMPDRTGAVLAGIEGGRVLPLPITLQEFTAYDLYADFSGMLAKESFHAMHMTDFALAEMGIEPSAIADHRKAPRLVPPAAPVAVRKAIADARIQAQGRPLVAVIFTATKTRTMPDELAAAIMRTLSPRFQPVIVLPPGLDGDAFLDRYALDQVINLSPVSRDFAHYLSLLHGLDAIISVDTSAVHVGAGLAKPTVGIFNSIDHRLRVRYSPTVLPMQLSYQGRTCQAPCGASKNRFYFNSSLSADTPIRWDFGYACDESFDQQAMEKWLTGQLNAIRDGISSRPLADIRLAASTTFTTAHTPCWQTLNPEAVVANLIAIMTACPGPTP